MKSFKSHPDFFKSLDDSINQALGFEFGTALYHVDHHSWGRILNVHSDAGEMAGQYDIIDNDGHYIFIEAH